MRLKLVKRSKRKKNKRVAQGLYRAKRFSIGQNRGFTLSFFGCLVSFYIGYLTILEEVNYDLQ